MSEDPFGIVATVLGKGKNGDDDGENTGKGPENGGGLWDNELATKTMREGDALLGVLHRAMAATCYRGMRRGCRGW